MALLASSSQLLVLGVVLILAGGIAAASAERPTRVSFTRRLNCDEGPSKRQFRIDGARRHG